VISSPTWAADLSVLIVEYEGIVIAILIFSFSYVLVYIVNLFERFFILR
jgi:ABC-type multidrug transport system permease subunit